MGFAWFGAAARHLGWVEAALPQVRRDRSTTDPSASSTSIAQEREGANPDGGGLHLTGAGSVRIDDSSVLRSSAAAEGGGL